MSIQETFEIGGRLCHVFGAEKPEVVLLQIIGPRHAETLESQIAMMQAGSAPSASADGAQPTPEEGRAA